MLNINWGFFTSRKKTKIIRKSTRGKSSWGVTAIQVEINRWVHAFDRKFAR